MLRRGQPTAHRKFDEATAILAGDGLLTFAFDILSRPETHANPAIRIALVMALARAAGLGGMAGGQMLDLGAEGRFGAQKHGAADVRMLQAMKTGALLRFACQAGAILAGGNAAQRAALERYGAAVGEAFQIADDLLDIEGDPALVGKQTGKDAAAGKATFVSVLGVAGAKARLARARRRSRSRAWRRSGRPPLSSSRAPILSPSGRLERAAPQVVEHRQTRSDLSPHRNSFVGIPRALDGNRDTASQRCKRTPAPIWRNRGPRQARIFGPSTISLRVHSFESGQPVRTSLQLRETKPTMNRSLRWTFYAGAAALLAAAYAIAPQNPFPGGTAQPHKRRRASSRPCQSQGPSLRHGRRQSPRSGRASA